MPAGSQIGRMMLAEMKGFGGFARGLAVAARSIATAEQASVVASRTSVRMARAGIAYRGAAGYLGFAQHITGPIGPRRLAMRYAMTGAAGYGALRMGVGAARGAGNLARFGSVQNPNRAPQSRRSRWAGLGAGSAAMGGALYGGLRMMSRL